MLRLNSKEDPAPAALTTKAKPPLLASENSSGFSSRRESLESEDDPPSPTGLPASAKLVGAGGASEVAGLLLGTSPFSTLLSSEDDEASTASSSFVPSSSLESR